MKTRQELKQNFLNHRKSFSSQFSSFQVTCVSCYDDSKPSLDYFRCFSCSSTFCSSCSVFLEFTSQKVSFCASCFGQIEQRFSVLSQIKDLAMKREKKADLHHSLLTTKEKSKECLIVIRELNLSHSNQTEISTSIERKIERKLVEKHEKMRNLQENLNSERRLKETLSNDIQNLSEQIEKLKNELNDLKLLVSHDTEKIIDLEEKLKEQVSDSERIKETLNHIVEQKIQEIEVFNSSESLNMKLAGVRAEVHEAKKTNEILRKTLQEIKVLKANEEHPHRVSFENRSENLRKMIEQYICQDLELKELQIKLDTEISSKTCKCHIM